MEAGEDALRIEARALDRDPEDVALAAEQEVGLVPDDDATFGRLLEAYLDVKRPLTVGVFADQSFEEINEIAGSIAASCATVMFPLAIRASSGPLTSSDLVAKLLWQTQFIVVASPKFLESHGTPKTPNDLVGAPCVALGTGRCLEEMKTLRNVLISMY